MKKIAIGVLTAAAVFGAAAPAMAQVGFYAGPGGVGIGVGPPGPYYGECAYGYPCDGGYYDYYGGPGVVVEPGFNRGWHHHYRHWH